MAIFNKCTSGIAGLDDILSGGLPQGSTYLIEGHPGVGKTTLAMQFLLAGARAGERCLYIALSETKREIQMIAKSHDWDLSGIDVIELSTMQNILEKSAKTTLFQANELELSELTRYLTEEIGKRRPQRLVVDSLSELRLLTQNAARFRRQVLSFKQYFAETDSTVLLLDDQSSISSGEMHIHSIVNGVILLSVAPLKYGVFRRYLSVSKLRGVSFREGNHDYVIVRGGITVFPRLVAREHQAAFARREAVSGNAQLDTLVGGGLHYGTSNLLMGAAGTGKSTVASMYAHAAASRGEKVVYYQFDETTATLMRRAAEMGIDFKSLIDAGNLSIEQIDPAVIAPGELAYDLRRRVEEDGVTCVVIDSLNGYATAMPHEDFLHLHLHELLVYLNQQGVLTIMILAQHGLVGPGGATIDVSYLADTVVIFRYFEAVGSVRKAISVIKKRSGAHESTVRELDLTSGGVRVGPPLTQFQGVLTGTPHVFSAPRGSGDGMSPNVG